MWLSGGLGGGLRGWGVKPVRERERCKHILTPGFGLGAQEAVSPLFQLRAKAGVPSCWGDPKQRSCPPDRALG